MSAPTCCRLAIEACRPRKSSALRLRPLLQSRRFINTTNDRTAAAGIGSASTPATPSPSPSAPPNLSTTATTPNQNNLRRAAAAAATTTTATATATAPADSVPPPTPSSRTENENIEQGEEGNSADTSSRSGGAAPLPPNVLAAHRVIQRHEAPLGLPTASLQLRSYSLRNLEFYADFCMRAAYYLNLAARGPNPLPRRRERWTVLRSNFIFKKSQENFERITHKRLITILDGESSAVETWLAFVRKHQFYGVGMKANVWAWEGLDVAQEMDRQYETQVKTSLEEKMALFGFADSSPMSLSKMIERQGHRSVGAPMSNLPWERTPYEEKRELTTAPENASVSSGAKDDA